MTKQKPAEEKHRSNGRADRHTSTESRQKPSSKHHERQLETFHGVLEDFNFSPKGGVEGFLLHSDGHTVQVNVTADVGFAVVRGIGQNVEASVEPEPESGKHGKGDHPVYRLVTLTGTDGKPLIFAGLGAAHVVTVQGVVKRINYSRHGEANGVILDSGAFIYLKPEGMKHAGLKVGDHVTAEGTAGMMPLGQQVVEAKTINGTSVTAKKPARAANDRKQ